MADAAQTLKVLREASIQLRATHGRRGTVVELPKSAEVLIAGDLHGNLANFRAILELADLGRHPERHLVLQEFVHGAGRYPQGGCTSHQLLDLVAALKCQYPHRVHLLLGNHELAEWTGRLVAKAGVPMNALFQQGIQTAYPERFADVLGGYHQFFSSMLLGVRTRNRVFVSHSIPPERFWDRFDPGIFELPVLPAADYGPDTSVYQLLWGRDVGANASQRFAALVNADWLVTGHIASEMGYSIPNPRQIIVDCVARPAACLLLPTDRPVQALVDWLWLLDAGGNWRCAAGE